MVIEPNDGFSKFGVWMPTLEGARRVTLVQAVELAGAHTRWICENYSSWARAYPEEAVYLLDVSWNAGRRTANRLAVAGPDDFMSRRTRYYDELASRPRYSRYRAGWTHRTVLLKELVAEGTSIDLPNVIARARLWRLSATQLFPWTEKTDHE